MLPLDEIAMGAVTLARENFGAEPDRLITEIARGLGFKATSDTLRRRILEGIESAQRGGQLIDQSGLLQATESLGER